MSQKTEESEQTAQQEHLAGKPPRYILGFAGGKIDPRDKLERNPFEMPWVQYSDELLKGWWIGHQAKLYGIEEALRRNPYDLKSSLENSETKESNV